MSERNERVANLLAANAPAARDRTFEVKVMAQIERRRFTRTVTRNFGLAALSALILALMAPLTEPLPALMGDWAQAHLSVIDILAVTTLMLSAALALWQAKLARES